MKKNAYLLITLVIIVIGVAAYVITKPNANTNNKNTPTTNTNVNSAARLNSNSAASNTNSAKSNTNAAGNVNVVVNTTASNTNAVSSPTTRTVSVTDTGFVPSLVTIAANDTVSWVNNRTTTVYVAPDDHPSHKRYAGIWNDTGAGRISSGQKYTFTFTTPGTYTYHDHLNSSMTGTIIVQ